MVVVVEEEEAEAQRMFWEAVGIRVIYITHLILQDVFYSPGLMYADVSDNKDDS